MFGLMINSYFYVISIDLVNKKIIALRYNSTIIDCFFLFKIMISKLFFRNSNIKINDNKFILFSHNLQNIPKYYAKYFKYFPTHEIFLNMETIFFPMSSG